MQIPQNTLEALHSMPAIVEDMGLEGAHVSRLVIIIETSLPNSDLSFNKLSW